jgi:hypothetical protein
MGEGVMAGGAFGRFREAGVGEEGEEGTGFRGIARGGKLRLRDEGSGDLLGTEGHSFSFSLPLPLFFFCSFSRALVSWIIC